MKLETAWNLKQPERCFWVQTGITGGWYKEHIRYSAQEIGFNQIRYKLVVCNAWRVSHSSHLTPKQEMFLNWAINRSCITHDLLLGLSNILVNRFCFQLSESLPSLSLDPSYNLLISKGLTNESVTITYYSARQISYVKPKWNILQSIWVSFCFVLFLFCFFLEGGEGRWAKFSMATFLQLKLKGNFFKNWAWSPVLGIRRYWNSTLTSWLFIVHSHITLKYMLYFVFLIIWLKKKLTSFFLACCARKCWATWSGRILYSNFLLYSLSFSISSLSSVAWIIQNIYFEQHRKKIDMNHSKGCL